MTSHADRPRTDGVRSPATFWLYRFRWFGRFVIGRRYDVRVLHAERFPADGPVIVAANHIGVIDGPLLAIFAPRPVHAWTKIEMFRGALGRFLSAVGQIPLDRFRSDPLAVKVALRTLRDGRVVGVFPEGTRGNGELDTYHRGAAYLALVTGAPVLPLTFIGSRESGGSSGSLPKKGARIHMVVGDPVRIDAVPWPRTPALVEKATLDLHRRMLAGIQAALAETGRALPGPLPTVPALDPTKDPDD